MNRFLAGWWILLIGLGALHGMDIQGGHYFIVSATDTVKDDLLYFGRSLEMKGYVSSDIFFFGEDIRVEGPVEDDVLIFARRAVLRGEVRGNVFFFGEVLRVEGMIHGSVRSMGRMVVLAPGARILGNVYSGSQTFVLQEARVEGSITGGAGSATFNGRVNGSVTFEANDVQFGSHFQSGGGVTITFLKQRPDTIPNAPGNLEIRERPSKPFYKSPWRIWFFLSALTMGLLFIALFPNAVWEMTLLTATRPLKTGGMGALFFLLFPILTLLSIIVPPLMVTLGAFYLLLVYLSKLLGAGVLGQLLWKRFQPNIRPNRYLAYLLGFILVYGVGFIPILGTLFVIAVALIGTGALIQVMWRTYQGSGAEAAG